MLKVAEAVDALLEGRELVHGGAVALFHLSVVLEEGHVVDGRFNAQNEAELVVHLAGRGAHVVADAGAFDPSVEVVAQFVPLPTRQHPSDLVMVAVV